MRFTPLLLLTVLFCHSHLIGHSSEAALNNGTADGVSQPEFSVQQNRKRIEFIDLNEDVKYHIVEQLSLMDLMILAEAIPEIRPLAVAVFRTRYDELEMQYIFPNNVPYGRKFDVDGRRIKTYFYEFTLSLLKHFGCAIKKLTNKLAKTHENYAMIDKYINKYSGQSLIQIDLGYTQTFKNFTKPFAQVTDLSFFVAAEVGIGALTLEQLFPNLCRWKLDLDGNIDFSFLNRNFPHLEHLYMLFKDETWQRRDQIEQFLRNNNQIRSVNIYFIQDHYPIFKLDEINDMLPNIENLTVQTFHIGNDTVHFQNVKHFTFNSHYASSIDKLFFPQLESMSMTFMFSNEFDPWMRFWANHRNLKQLTIKTYSGTANDMVRFVSELTVLREITMEWIGHFNIEIISQIIDMHQTLNKFEFATNRPTDEGMATLRSQFENEWNIVHIEYHWFSGLSFVRKNAIPN